MKEYERRMLLDAWHNQTSLQASQNLKRKNATTNKFIAKNEIKKCKMYTQDLYCKQGVCCYDRE